MIKINQQQNNQISFRGIKPTIRIGEQAIREFRMKFPALKSSTTTITRILQAEALSNTASLVSKMQRLAWRQHGDWCHIQQFLTANSFDGYIKTILPLIKEYNVANCGEMTLITQHKLLNQGIKTNVIRFIIKNKKDRSSIQRLSNDHWFLVLNMAKDAPYNEPQKWGNKSVIIDPWIKKSSAAREMVEYYKHFFRIDESKEYLCFEKYDTFDVDGYLNHRY